MIYIFHKVKVYLFIFNKLFYIYLYDHIIYLFIIHFGPYKFFL